jgi:predicted XRE-type DNA-binding protein
MKKRDKTYASVWDALADTPEQAANLQARVDLMRQIAELIQAEGWKQMEAAERCGVTQPRIKRCAARARVAVLARCAGEHRDRSEDALSRRSEPTKPATSGHWC